MSSLRHKVVFGLAVGAVAGAVTFGGYIFETNNSGYYQVKQAAITGNMSAKNTAGVYLQMFGDIFTYKVSETSYFSDGTDGEGQKGLPAVNVRFNDGGTAKISGSIKYRLSSDPKTQLGLHSDFRSFGAVEQDLIRQVVTASLMQSATLFKAEEIYSTRRSEFIAIAEEQIRKGIFETESNEVRAKDAEGNDFIERRVTVKRDKEGQPIIRTDSAFKKYGIDVIQFVIKELDFDDTIDRLIAAKKEAEQKKVVAKANAEKSKQDAIAAEEKGKADVAKAEAEALVEKKTAVIAAEREKEVAAQNALKALEDAKAVKAKGEAEAYAAKLKVAAGLSPREQAEIDRDTAIGVAEKMAQVKFPQMMVIGGGSNGQNPLNPFDAVGLESFLKISKGLVKVNK